MLKYVQIWIGEICQLQAQTLHAHKLVCSLILLSWPAEWIVIYNSGEGGSWSDCKAGRGGTLAIDTEGRLVGGAEQAQEGQDWPGP